MRGGSRLELPTLDTIEKRIWQLILLMTVVILYLTLLLVAFQFTGFMGFSEVVSLPENAYKYAVSLAVLILLFCSYVVLHHRKLFKVSRALLQERERTESLDRSLRTVKSLLEVSSSINARKRLSGILNLITREAKEAFLADSASIMLLDAGTGSLETATSCGRDTEGAKDARVGIGESVAGWVAANGKPLLLNGQLSSREFPGLEPRAVPVSSSLCVPLRSGSRSIGVMNVTRDEGGDAFTEDDLDLISVFANNAAIAIKNAGLYARLRKFSAGLEEKIRERTRELVIANRAKSDFLASVSHELRTPLNAIIGFSDVLLKEHFGELNEDQQEYANEILKSGHQLLGIIDAVLDFSNLAEGRMDLELTNVRLASLLEKVVTEQSKAEAAKGRRIVMEVSPGLEGTSIEANEKALEQVLSLLLSNAVKFTPEGGAIRVEAEPVGDCLARFEDLMAEGLLALPEEGPPRRLTGLRGVEIAVRDIGKGIEPDHLPRIFEPFFQAGEGLGGKRPGTGLGLSIARRWVEMHGGLIWAESEGKNRGSRFAFLLPLNPRNPGGS